MRMYMGQIIERAGINGSGIRWVCLCDGHGFLRADTLQGIKQLIRKTLKGECASENI